MLGMGAWTAYRQRSTEDFFVGGRTLPSWAVGISLLASVFSTITYLGLPSEMFRAGLGYLVRELSIPVTWCIVWFVVMPFFARLRLVSAYEYLEYRFNFATRVLAACLCILLLVGWMAVATVTASRAMAEIVQWNVSWFFGTNTQGFRDADVQLMILLIGGFSMVYTTLGGLRAVVWTDVVQFLIMLAGAVFSVAYVATHTHSTPWDWWQAWKEYPYREATPWFSWDVRQRSSLSFIVLGMTFWMVCTYSANQIALQRYFAVRDLRAARQTYLVSVLANLSLAALLAAVGYALLYFVLHSSTPIGQWVLSEDAMRRTAGQDAVFPQFIRHCMPDGLRGLIVAALFAAAMSTIDSGANSVATIVMADFLRVSSTAAATPSLRIARLTTALTSVAIVSLAWALYDVSKSTDIITMCQKGFNCYLGPLGGLFALALFCHRAIPATVIPAVLIGVGIGLAAAYSRELLGVDFSTHLVIPSSCLATVICGWCGSWVFGRVDQHRSRWMWWQVVRHGSPRIGEDITV